MEDQQLISACVEKWDFNWLLHRATQRVGAAFADEITKFGITLRGQLILQALANEEAQRTQLKLGAMLGLDKTTLTSELDKLERLGLITRVPDPKDRRVRTPVITDEGLELQKQAGAALAEVEWPRKIAPLPEAAPVADCPVPLAFPVAAQDAVKDGGADLMSGLLGMAAARSKAKPTPESTAALAATRWCRDPGPGGNAGVYRQNADTENYRLAVGDNGNGIWVGPDPGAKLMAMTEQGKPAESRYSITAVTAAQNIGFVTQDRLPSPQRVIEIIAANRRVTTVPTWGKSKTIGVNSAP